LVSVFGRFFWEAVGDISFLMRFRMWVNSLPKGPSALNISRRLRVSVLLMVLVSTVAMMEEVRTATPMIFRSSRRSLT
jgi:hypothetical protein